MFPLYRPFETRNGPAFASRERQRACDIRRVRADSEWPMPDYAAIVEEMKCRYDVRVKRWRRAMTGCAWRVFYTDGTVINWIESPIPKTPISLAIFLHEVGHHVIGFDRYRLRCEEEFHAWDWALSEMRRLGVEPDEKVKTRVELSMRYAVGKALRRGLKYLPESLCIFAAPLPRAA
jgi:hypothetical protein